MIDAHCHVQDGRLAPDLPAVLDRAKDAGVDRVMSCGSSEEDWQSLLQAEASFPGYVMVSLGLHPWYVGDAVSGWEARLEGLLIRHPRAGVGEIGLDHAVAPREAISQSAAFLAQLSLAWRLGRPASIHCRRAWEELLRCLRSAGPRGPGFVVHSFSGSVETMREIVALGGYVSFSGSLTLSGNRRAAGVAAAAPSDRILVETDSPDLMPVTGVSPETFDARGRPAGVNEPANLQYVLRRLALIRGISAEEAERVTDANARRLFAGCWEAGGGRQIRQN